MKVISVTTAEPFEGETHFFFGSLVAMYEHLPAPCVGITYRSLCNALQKNGGEYRNEKVQIRVSQLRRQNRTKTAKQ